MASELFNSFGNANQNQTQQNPKDAALALLKQNGFSIPSGMENNPQGIIQMVMQSGRIPQGRLNMAQQMLQKMFRR